MMSSLVQQMFQTAFGAFLKRDSESCHHVAADDEEIDILEKQVDQAAIALLIRFHPVASDMREVICAMKIGSNLERIADQAVSIGRRAKRLNNRPMVQEIALLEPPYRVALTIFLDCIWTFANGDYELARTLKLKDRELDTLTDEVIEKLTLRAALDAELVTSYVDLIFVVRALEKIGDYSANIAENSFWRDQATDIRHTYGPKKE
jgi:phosphate transport system protein